MFETVTVDEAIKKGRLLINAPVIVIIYGTWALCIYLGVATNTSIWLVITLAILAFIAGWAYWSVAITRWRLWAFENVRNIHELKKRSIKKKLIWPDGHFFEKTEIWTSSQKQHWSYLLAKFNKPDVFVEDYTIPPKSVLYYSKNEAKAIAGIGVILICGGIYLYVAEENLWRAVFFIIGGGYMVYSGYKKATDRSPQIILSNEGVETANISFYSWEDIYNEDTKFVHHGKNATTYFIYDCPEGHKKITLGEFDVSIPQFEKLLLHYRARYNYQQEKRNRM